LRFWNEEEIGNTVPRAKPWFENLTTLSKIEGQWRQGDGPRAVIPIECEGSKKDFSRRSK